MVLLDTPTLLWWANRDSALSPRALGAIESERPGGEIKLSAISAYQIAQWITEGRLTLRMTPEDWFAHLHAAPELTIIPIDIPLALHAASLPLPTPESRLLAATARHLGCPLVTPNTALAASGLLKTIW
jgi:PIN domain nuclease of toxin-antitoxin system